MFEGERISIEKHGFERLKIKEGYSFPCYTPISKSRELYFNPENKI